MKKYFYLEFKRTAKIFPFLLLITAILVASVAAILYGALSSFSDREDNKRFTIALSGDMDNEYLSWGIAAMTNFDESRFSMDFVEMDEADAKNALEKGKISAYVVLPEDFVDKAISGNVEPITYVTSTGTESLNTLFKKEITSLVTDIVVYSEKGVYGINDALDENGHGKISGKHMDQLSLEYVELIFRRSEFYSVEELGISDGLSTPEYYICAMTVTLLMLMGIPFGAIYIKKDMAFCRLLKSRGYSSLLQVFCEYAVHFSGMLLLMLSIVLLGSLVPESTDFLGELTAKLIPVVIMLSAFNMLIFELSDNTVSGVLLHFFLSVGLCYLSGCFYPVHALPEAVRALAPMLPTGIARGYLATCFNGDAALGFFVGSLLCSAIFFSLTWLLRVCRIKGMGVRR